MGSARSGWRRGLVFFAVDLVGFVGSVLAAVRFHEIGAVAFGWIGLSARWAAFLGGLAIFVPLIALTAVAGSRASRAVYKPGLFTLNRVLGAVLAAALALAVVIVGLLFLRAAPTPFGVGDLIERSSIAPVVIEASEPLIAALDQTLGLELCGGELSRIIPEVCDER